MKKRKTVGSVPEDELEALIVNPDIKLFAEGMTVKDYFLDGSAIGFRHSGREYDLIVDHDELALSMRRRLIELGVEQR